MGKFNLKKKKKIKKNALSRASTPVGLFTFMLIVIFMLTFMSTESQRRKRAGLEKYLKK